ncbi:hypothetical protein [Streptomyces sp. NBC_00690]|uniref:hypothetical protein n=1 Tax=Streptomyces sp. NBC_00690 TaxID=2975808 RepID=UPI002E2BF6EC|nr:hypothetical protein [Streptomyces sp. NBC_00690]
MLTAVGAISTGRDAYDVVTPTQRGYVTTRLVHLEMMLIDLLGSATGGLLVGAAALWLLSRGVVQGPLVLGAGVIVAGRALATASEPVPVLIQRPRAMARLLAKEWA